MKTRNILLTASFLFMFICQSARSQNLVPGITAGASMNSANLKQSIGMVTDMSNLNGVEAGLFLSINTGALYVKPMAVASFLRGTVTSSSDGELAKDADFNLSTLEVPVLVGLKLLPVLSVEAGPSWNYLMSYTKEVNGVTLDLSRSSLAYRAGLRANFSRLGVFAHYGGVINGGNSTPYELTRPSRIILGATFDLVSGK